MLSDFGDHMAIEHIYQIGDEARTLKNKLHRHLEQKEKINSGRLLFILTKLCELHEATAMKLDEVVERLVRFEDEVRKGARPEMRAVMKKKTRRKKRRGW